MQKILLSSLGGVAVTTEYITTSYNMTDDILAILWSAKQREPAYSMNQTVKMDDEKSFMESLFDDEVQFCDAIPMRPMGPVVSRTPIWVFT